MALLIGKCFQVERMHIDTVEHVRWKGGLDNQTSVNAANSDSMKKGTMFQEQTIKAVTENFVRNQNQNYNVVFYLTVDRQR